LPASEAPTNANVYSDGMSLALQKRILYGNQLTIRPFIKPGSGIVNGPKDANLRDQNGVSEV
jgi:hypothetical protein